jgi:hypothetical protein
VYKTVLVRDQIQDGRTFLRSIQEESFPVTAALWRYMEEHEAWKLVIVSPLADTEGLHEAYVRIVRVLRKLGDATQLTVGDILVVRPDSAQFRRLQSTIEMFPGGGVRGSGQALQDADFGDAYIYHWQAA